MRDEQQALYEQLLAFEFDEPGVELSFAQRLAKENGWRPAYAERAILEYKRFLLLAMHAGHVVTPSEQVDQVWHLHLTYSRSYWDRLCRQVLGRSLHHGPTQGGNAKLTKYKSLYQRTLDSYEAFFGHAPPADLWSDVETRFTEDAQHVVVNTARNWVIPKPRWPRAAKRLNARVTAPMLGIFACGIPLVLGSLNPLDMRGPAFLMLYVSLVALAIGGALLVRNWLLSWDDPAVVDADKPLDCYEVACLANGPARIVDAAASNLVAAGHLRLVEEPKGLLRAASVRLHQGEPLPHDAPDIELALYCAAGTPVDNLLKLRKPADDATSAIESNLIHRGLVRAKSWLGFAQLVPALLAASPLVIGIPKVLIGQQRDKPVGFLILLCVVTAGIAVAFLMWRKYRTSAGDRLLSEYTEQYRAVREANASDTTTAGAGQMGMLVGLFGAAILVGSPFSPLQTMMTRASGGTGCSSSGCTTSSGCGGDSGGGCGGGGCGGCGGD